MHRGNTGRRFRLRVTSLGATLGVNEMKIIFSGPTQYGARLQTTSLCINLKLEDLLGYIYNGITCEYEVIIVPSY